MRAEPSLSAVKIQAIPFGKEVVVCPEYQSPEEIVDGVKGKWLRTFYQDRIGYMFSGYMEAQPKINVILPDSWMGDLNELDNEYHGLYMIDYDKEYNEQRFLLRAKESLNTSVASLEVDPKTIFSSPEVEPAHFYVSGLDLPKTEGIQGQLFDSKFLYPGESTSLTLDNAHFHVYAKGRIVENTSGNDINPISMIKNYELHVRRTTHDGDWEDKVIYKVDIPAWFADGYEGGIFLQWMGDLDNDGELDLLLKTAKAKSCWNVVLMLSSKAERGHFFKQVTKYEECDGC